MSDDNIIYFSDMEWVPDPASLEDHEEDPELDGNSIGCACNGEQQQCAPEQPEVKDTTLNIYRHAARFTSDDPKRLPE